MALALFSRLTKQLQDAEAELEKLLRGHLTQQKVRKEAPQLYDEYVHSSAMGQGIAAVYGGLEQIMESIVNEVDDSPIKGENFHEKLIDQLSVRVEGVRERLLSDELGRLLHELRSFRHVIRHNYPGRIEHGKVLQNLDTLKKAMKLFPRDYHVLRESLEAEEEPAALPSRRKR